MGKPKLSILVAITICFTFFTLGFLLGNNTDMHGINVTVQKQMLIPPTTQEVLETQPIEQTTAICFPILINQAGKEELMALPGIGEVLAQRILDYRTKNGEFSHPNELLNIEGIGKKRLEKIIDLISIGG